MPMPTQAGFRSRLLKAVGVKHARFFPLSQVLLAFSPSTIFSTSPNLPLIVIIYTTLLNYIPPLFLPTLHILHVCGQLNPRTSGRVPVSTRSTYNLWAL
jgi:hypothetical protein